MFMRPRNLGHPEFVLLDSMAALGAAGHYLGQAAQAAGRLDDRRIPEALNSGVRGVPWDSGDGCMDGRGGESTPDAAFLFLCVYTTLCHWRK